MKDMSGKELLVNNFVEVIPGPNNILKGAIRGTVKYIRKDTDGSSYAGIDDGSGNVYDCVSSEIEMFYSSFLNTDFKQQPKKRTNDKEPFRCDRNNWWNPRCYFHRRR